MLRTLTLVLCLFLSTELAAQDELEGREYIGLYIMPTSLIDPTPRLRLGAVYNSGKDWGMSLDIGYGNGNLKGLHPLSLNEDIIDYQFIEIRPELKHYRKRSEKTSSYMSVEAFVHVSNSVYDDRYLTVEAGAVQWHYREAEVDRLKTGIIYKLGREEVRGKWLLDMYAGVGVAYRHLIIHQAEESNFGYPYPQGVPGTDNVRAMFMPHIALGMKLGRVL